MRLPKGSLIDMVYMKRNKILIIGAFILTALICLCSCQTEVPLLSEITGQNEQGSETNDFREATIAKVVDGDTVKIYLDGIKTTVRIIGINTPESVHNDEEMNTEEGREASSFTEELLPVGTKVYIEYDLDDEDQYGRTLAYLWLRPDVDTGSYEDFCKYNVGAVIMQNTYCEAVYYKPNRKYLDWLRKLEAEYQK